MENFWDFSVWGDFHLIAMLLLSLLAANALKRVIPMLRASLIPTSVLGGALLLLASGLYKLFTGDVMFDTAFFAGKGMALLETITYHTLALGFIASTLKTSDEKMTKQRTVEIFNTGVTTVSTYLMQAVLGFGITMVAAKLVSDFFPAAGVLLPFGYGQGPGQAMNYGGIYELEYGFEGGKSFGLTIAALGFISAALGGVIHLNLLKKKRKINIGSGEEISYDTEEIQLANEIPMQGSMDKLTVQVAFVFAAYFMAHGLMYMLGRLLPGMRSVIYGFNFLLGVMTATLLKVTLGLLEKKGIMKRRYTNNFLMTRVSNFFFDIMVVASIAAIRLGILEQYWGIILVLGVSALVLTYLYNYVVAKALFPAYQEEQFLTMYGMLTGTASTGIALLRELDGRFETPAADNLVYQNFPAIVFGFPMMLLATLAPRKPGVTMVCLVAFFLVMNVILFRSFLFRRRKTPVEQ
ncbi:MAG: hypothetical protein E7443_00890 [Ruminococcaceae bacterium]|nr:hypothetical protein [Oscillospiraceae bacterium]